MQVLPSQREANGCSLGGRVLRNVASAFQKRGCLRWQVVRTMVVAKYEARENMGELVCFSAASAGTFAPVSKSRCRSAE